MFEDLIRLVCYGLPCVYQTFVTKIGRASHDKFHKYLVTLKVFLYHNFTLISCRYTKLDNLFHIMIIVYSVKQFQVKQDINRSKLALYACDTLANKLNCVFMYSVMQSNGNSFCGLGSIGQL